MPTTPHCLGSSLAKRFAADVRARDVSSNLESKLMRFCSRRLLPLTAMVYEMFRPMLDPAGWLLKLDPYSYCNIRSEAHYGERTGPRSIVGVHCTSSNIDHALLTRCGVPRTFRCSYSRPSQLFGPSQLLRHTCSTLLHAGFSLSTCPHTLSNFNSHHSA